MKKNILKATLVAAFALVAGFNVYNSQKSDVMSELALANVEALADDENPMCENCVNKGTTTKLSYDIGGIAGRIGKSGEENDVQIINCSNESDFDVENTTDMGADLGGIVGYVYAGKIQMCQNQGKLKGYRIGIGGIAG